MRMPQEAPLSMVQGFNPRVHRLPDRSVAQQQLRGLRKVGNDGMIEDGIHHRQGATHSQYFLACMGAPRLMLVRMLQCASDAHVSRPRRATGIGARLLSMWTE